MASQRIESSLHLIADPSVSARSIHESQGRRLLTSFQSSSENELGKTIVKTLDLHVNASAPPSRTRALADSSYYPSDSEDIDSTPRRTPGQGWSRPGPGRPVGSGRMLQEQDLSIAFNVFVSDSLRSTFRSLLPTEALDRKSKILPRLFDVELGYNCVSEWRSSLPRFSTEKNFLWSMSSFLGTSGVLCKVNGNKRAIAVSTGACSDCQNEDESFTELPGSSHCRHVNMLKKAIMEAGMRLSLSQNDVLSVMEQYYAEIYEKKNILICSEKRGPLYAVVVKSSNGEEARSNQRLTVLRRAERSKIWICLSPTCVTGGRFVACSHVILVSEYLKTEERGQPTDCKAGHRQLPFSQSEGLQIDEKNGNRATRRESSMMNQSCFQMIPSEEAFSLDLRMTNSFYINEIPVLESCSICTCQANAPNAVFTAVDNTKPRRNENQCGTSMRCHIIDVLIECDSVSVPCQLKEYTCRICGRCARDGKEHPGLLWLSRYTAYTEVSLFRAIYQMVFGGSSISVVAEAREEMMMLNGISTSHRSGSSFRKALNAYTEYIQIPRWLFRCSNCAELRSGSYVYKHLSFDGLQVGYRKSRSTGSQPTHDVHRVARNDKAPALAYLIQGKTLRSVLFETLRARPVPAGVDSISTLCSKVFSLRIQTQEMALAVSSAIKLLDEEGWRTAKGSLARGSDDPESCAETSNVQVLFNTVLDCTRVARVLGVMLCDLSRDLVKKVDPYERDILEIYGSTSREKLEGWLANLRAKQFSNVIANQDQLGVEASEERTPEHSGISEHAKIITSPLESKSAYRWTNNVLSEASVSSFSVSDESLSRFQVRVRNNGGKSPGFDNTIKVLMLITALLKEPCSVWMRSGSFHDFMEVTNALVKVNSVPDIINLQRIVRASPANALPLLCEGALATAWSIEGGSSELIRSVGNLLLSVPTQHDSYLIQMVDRRMPSKLAKGYITPLQYEQLYFRDTSSTCGRDTSDVASSSVPSGGTLDQEGISWDGDVFSSDFGRIRPAPMECSSNSANQSKTDSTDGCVIVYPGKKDLTPGTFIANCTCKHSKSLAIVNLRNPEGSRVPVNFVMARCKVLPEIVVYDFSCGSLSSALGISAYLVEHTHFVVDRFHFNSHRTCSLAMHPDSHGDMKGSNTSSQEQRNSGIRPLQNSLREMTEDNFKNFVAISHAMLNAKAFYRDYLDEAQKAHGERVVTTQVRGWAAWFRGELKRRCSES